MKLPRPYIPLRVRVQVAVRQCRELGLCEGVFSSDFRNLATALRYFLGHIHGNQKVELHHRPALCNRARCLSSIAGGIRYDPDANDPDYLVYLSAADHDIETRVRGQHGDYSDLAKARKRKRIERKAKRPKRKWPSRPFPKRKP